MTLPALTLPPTAPARTQSASTFVTNADAFVAWQSVTFVPELNALLPMIVTAGSATNYAATSTTSLAIGTGSKSLTVEVDKAFTTGQFVLVSNTGTPSNYMYGQVTSYNSTTGALVVNVTATSGSGTLAVWTVGLAPNAAAYLPTSGGTVSGNLTVTGTLSFSGAMTSGNLADAVGYKGRPQNQVTSAYTLALSDMGKHVFATGAAFNITVPLNSSVAFPVGTEITVAVGDAGKTLVQTAGVTLYLGGTTTTGNRTLAINSVATLIKVQTDVWFVFGPGVT